MTRTRVDHAAAVAELHEALVDRLEQMSTSEDWLRYLDTARKFHRYSPQNQMLLAIQGADGAVAGYRNWQRIPAQGGGTCQVAKGQTGLKVLAPMKATAKDVDTATGEEVTKHFLRGFRTVKVFHQGQLVAPPDLGEPAMPELLTGPNRYTHIWTSVRDQLEAEGFTLEEHTRTPIEKWNGLTNYTERKVLVADDLQAPQQIKTLLHEWAHVRLDHENRRDLGREILEVEAESVAYLVAQTINLDSQAYSVPYINGWSQGDTTLVESTAQQVLATAKELIQTLERELGVQLVIDAVDHALPETTDNVIALPGALTVATEPAPEQETEIGQTSLRDLPEPMSPASAIDHPDSSDFDFMRAVGAAFDDTQAAAFAEHIYRPDHAPQAAALLAESGRTATQTAKILTRFGIDTERVHLALTSPIADGDGDVAPLYPSEEVATAMSAIGAAPTETIDVATPDPDVLRNEQISDMRTLQRLVRTNADIGAVTQLARTLQIDPADVAQVCAATEVPPNKTVAIAVALRDGDGAAAMADLRAGWPDIGGGWESHAHPSMLPAVEPAPVPTLVPDIGDYDPIVDLFAQWDNMETPAPSPEPTMP